MDPGRLQRGGSGGVHANQRSGSAGAHESGAAPLRESRAARAAAACEEARMRLGACPCCIEVSGDLLAFCANFGAKP